MLITIKKWDNYDPKRDQKTYTWLRLDNDTFSGPEFFEYDAAEMTIIVSLLCESSKKNTPHLDLGMRYLKTITRCEEDFILRTLEKLVKSNFLVITPDSGATPDYTDTTPTNERTDVTNQTNEPSSRPDPEKIQRIDPEKVRELFDEMLGGKGKIKKVPGQLLPSNLRVDFLNITGNVDFNRIEKWKEYFAIVQKSDWLLNDFNTTLSWLLKPDNAFKVFEGTYDNREDKKTVRQAHSEAGAKADQLFDRILRQGFNNYIDTMNTMTDVELRAVEIFGGSSRVFGTTDFTLRETKAAFRPAYLAATKEIENASENHPLPNV